jgi:hypothetical protein
MSRKNPNETIGEWIQNNEPDYGDAVSRLMEEIKKFNIPKELIELIDYIKEFEDGGSPRDMGWVGDNGQP